MSRLGTVCAIAAAILLAGCGEKGNVFGFNRAGPDEFSVVRNPPLSMPPDATLRPPGAGTAAAERERSADAARASLVLGTPSADAGAQGRQGGRSSRGELALTARAAAYYGVEPDIRQVVDAESTQLAREGVAFADRLLFWQKKPPPGKALDADAESRRLRENQALGRPLNADKAPLIVRRKSSVSSLY